LTGSSQSRCAGRSAAGVRGRDLAGFGPALTTGASRPLRGEGGFQGGANLPTGIGWYRKHFNLPESFKDSKVAVEFDGVYENSEVWINGQYLGKRPYGFIGFSTTT